MHHVPSVSLPFRPENGHVVYEKSTFLCVYARFFQAFCKMDSTLDHSQTQADSWFESQPLGTKDRKEASLGKP